MVDAVRGPVAGATGVIEATSGGGTIVLTVGVIVAGPGFTFAASIMASRCSSRSIRSNISFSRSVKGAGSDARGMSAER